jgi:hypothetical protein
VHLAAVLVEHLLVAEGALKRSLADEHDRHEELRIEPEPDLLAHLTDPIRGEPLLPVGVVWQVCMGEPVCRAGRVTLWDPGRILPPERGEGDDACVEPDIPDLGDALYRLAA